MKQSLLPPMASSGWSLLARGDREDDAVVRCPAGHIHLDYGNLTLRFYRDEFLAFARLVAEAAARLQGFTGPGSDNSRSSTTFSLN